MILGLGMGRPFWWEDIPFEVAKRRSLLRDLQVRCLLLQHTTPGGPDGPGHGIPTTGRWLRTREATGPYRGDYMTPTQTSGTCLKKRKPPQIYYF